MSATDGSLSRRAFLSGTCAAGCLAIAGCSGTPDPAPERTGPLQVPVGDVPVGGGVIYRSDRVVVTQPEAGEFRAFSAVCTHDGCMVSDISNEQIVCRCHGSSFSITDGSVVRSPAQKPLPEKTVERAGDTLTIDV